jgi:acid phosphatase type 7
VDDVGDFDQWRGHPCAEGGAVAMRRLLVALVLSVAAMAVSPRSTSTAWSGLSALRPQPARAATAAAQDPVIAAAGDIACDPHDPGYNGGRGTTDRCQQKATSDLLVGSGLTAVLVLGDMQYNAASAANIAAVYNPTWGRVQSISHPTLGEHEGTASAYFNYWNGPGAADGPAGPRGKGWYSFDVGSWHLIALNSNCDLVGCAAGSQQEGWLRADLAAHPTACTLAYWHEPRYSSGHGYDHPDMQPLWKDLYDAGAELVLSGHSHDYERFAPMDPNGALDPAYGIRQFVVGTGGAFFTGLYSRRANSEVAQNNTFGVLRLTLHATSYDWQFVPVAGKTFTDSGSASCHGPPGAALPPPSRDTTPVISRLKVSPARFQISSARRRAVKRETVFSYRLSEAATVTFTIRRKFNGRKVSGRCVWASRVNRRNPSCLGYRRVGSFVQAGAAGRNTRTFTGRIGRKRLHPGSFRAILVATVATGNRSKPSWVDFKIVRR